MQLTKHNFFDPIIPYIKYMNSENQVIEIRVPYNLVLDYDEAAKYFKTDLTFCSIRRFNDVYEYTISGTLIDKDVFDYLFERMHNPF